MSDPVGDRAASMFDFLEIAEASRKRADWLQRIINEIHQTLHDLGDDDAHRYPSEALPEAIRRLVAAKSAEKGPA